MIPVSWKYRIRCASLDVTVQPILVWISALFCYAAAGLLPSRASLALYSQAHLVLGRVWGRRRAFPWLNHRIERTLAELCQRPGLIESLTKQSASGLELARGSGIVLKAPRLQAGHVVEKGVLLLKYSHRIKAFHECVDMEALLRHYFLVLEPSWTGYASLDFLAFTRYRDHSIVMLTPFRGDRELLEALGSNLIPIELGPGDWVNPRVFRPLEGEPKRYSAVMVARWSCYKRHDLLLRALVRISDPAFRVALVAVNRAQDTDRKAVLGAIAASGLSQQIDIFEDVAPEEVNRVLNQSKVNVLLSRQEGGNRALFEGFFAGVPGLAFRNHIGIRTAHFQSQTGRLIDRSALAAELLYFQDHWSEFDPRPWALMHIAPEISTRQLNEFLRQRSRERGEPWTRDIAMKCNRPGLMYYPNDEAGHDLPSMEALLHQFPLP